MLKFFINQSYYYKERIHYEFLNFIRNKKDILFIHIPKNAGMSVRRSLKLAGYINFIKSKNLSDNYKKQLIFEMSKHGENPAFEHSRLRDLINISNYKKKFAIIRNPWSRTVSRYLFAKQVIEIEKKYPSNKHNINSFEEFIEERNEWGNKPYYWHRAIRGWYNCYDYVLDTSNEIGCDILSFENLNNDLKNYLNIDFNLKKRNVTKFKSNYKSFYNSKTIQIIADWYKKDIEFFGYDFDTGPKKNFWIPNK